MENENVPDNRWKWRYSFMTGVMYGPIPVGIIAVVILLIIYFLFIK